MLRSALLALGATAALALAACGPLSTTTSSVSSANTNLRIIDGSPNAGALDVRVDSATGLSLLSNAHFASVGSYVQLSPIAHLIEVLPAGGTTATFTCATPAMAPSANYTVVIAGSASAASGSTGALQCQFFTEPLFTTAAGSYTINMHHAAVAAALAGNTTYAYGAYPPGTTNYGTPLGTVTFVPPVNNLGNSAGTAVSESGVTAAPGVGFWFAPSTAASPAPGAPASVSATILPSQGVAGGAGQSGSSDTGNTLPNGSLVNFSIYLLDAPGGGVTALGLFD